MPGRGIHESGKAGWGATWVSGELVNLPTMLVIAFAVAFGCHLVAPAHGLAALNSCTVNFTGGSRLPYPFCNASLDVPTRLAGARWSELESLPPHPPLHTPTIPPWSAWASQHTPGTAPGAI